MFVSVQAWVLLKTESTCRDLNVGCLFLLRRRFGSWTSEETNETTAALIFAVAGALSLSSRILSQCSFSDPKRQGKCLLACIEESAADLTRSSDLDPL